MPQAPRQHQPSNRNHSRREYDQRRGSAHERGYDAWWHKTSEQSLRQQIADEADPWCRYCGKRPATMIDHGIPPTRKFAAGTVEYLNLFRDQRYWIPCCGGSGSCNTLKGDKLPHELPQWMRDKLEAILRARGLM